MSIAAIHLEQIHRAGGRAGSTQKLNLHQGKNEWGAYGRRGFWQPRRDEYFDCDGEQHLKLMMAL